ncbi:MAG: hypothetical protein CMP59_08175 [Flavobacteriales bacterium]|nr:hypothetical protein [Flavobacteriales bacterium]
MLYRATNKQQNSLKLAFIFIILAPTIVYFFLSKDELALLTALFIAEMIFFGLLIRWHRRSAFELIFYPDKIIFRKKFGNKEVIFSYDQLKEVHFNDTSGSSAPSSNKFVFFSNGNSNKLHTDPVEYGESFITFVKFLKSKNEDFKTFIRPKGTKMHMRLRQEILNEEF